MGISSHLVQSLSPASCVTYHGYIEPLGAEPEPQPAVLPTMGISSRLVQSLRPSRQLLTLCWGLRRSQRGQAPGHTASRRAHRATPSDHAVVRLEMRSVGSWSAAHSNASVRFCFSGKYNTHFRGGSRIFRRGGVDPTEYFAKLSQ